MGCSVAITSGKGGVGKSSVCIGLGSSLASKGYQVCLIDMDLGLKNLDMMMGLQNRVYYDLMDVMEGKCTLQQALVKDKVQPNLSLIPACKSIQIKQFNQDKFTSLVRTLKEQYDYILLDTPAGIEGGFELALACADRFIVVSTLDATALQDADRIIGLLMKQNAGLIQLVLNRCNPKYIEKGISVQMEDALKWLSIELLGVVYEDEMIIKGHNQGMPIINHPKSITSQCFMAICNAFIGEGFEVIKYKEKPRFFKFF